MTTERGVILSVKEVTVPEYRREQHDGKALYVVTIAFGGRKPQQLTQWATDELNAYRLVAQTLARWHVKNNL